MDKTAQKILNFFTQFSSHEYATGEVILESGQTPEGIYYLESGRVQQYDIDSRGHKIVTNIYRPSSFFFMPWAINDRRNEWYFEAMTDVVIRLAPKAGALNFIKANDDVMFDFLKRLSSGAAGQQRRMAHLMGGSARTRLIYELIVQSERFGETIGDGSELRITEEELASLAGLTRETVSRELNVLQKQDLIDHAHKNVSIRNLNSLKDELGDTL